MSIFLKKLIRMTPIYSALKSIKEKRDLNNWEKQGRPIPTPHIVKQLTLRDFAEKYSLRVLVETGTFRGGMVYAMKDHFSFIYSIELSRELYVDAKKRFKGKENIKIIHGDSAIELRKLTTSIDQPALFWLDGHYSGGVTAKGDKDTPIYEELTHIFSRHQQGDVIIIDDARDFGTDPTYPSISELNEFIKANNPNVRMEVMNDSIRIFPSS